jgi:hypothetical protein
MNRFMTHLEYHDSNHIYTSSSDIGRDSSTFPEDINFVIPITVSRFHIASDSATYGNALSIATVKVPVGNAVEEVSCY